MDAANFAVDFTELLIRYTTSKTPNEKAELAGGSNALLTPEVIVEIVQQTLRAMLHTPNLPKISLDVYKTPVNDIVINTPDAPNVTRASLNVHGNGLVSEQDVNPISKAIEVSAEKKDPSLSEMHLSTKGRSGIFVHDDIGKSPGNCNVLEKINDDVFEESKKTPDATLQLKLDAARKCAADLIAKIDEIKGSSTVEAPKAIRRLSSVGAYPFTMRTSTMMRSIQPSKMRRSFTAFPGTTPTSSRLNTTAILGENLSKRKNTSSASLQITSTNTTTISSKSLAPLSIIRPNTNLSFPVTKKSPGSDGKPAKNPKYAHVQSSIPKPSFVPKSKAK
ncbi:hypothetical protein KPH14_007354 [Odynerus spinipes]|uniref:Uncharacterized protein n=1 Tax=Odynerus spinipes TaxID=1348599 RepID=A0AAD9RAQ2_9HYME|nr:hypothetical protein KPH14_007354 [Odynerus spinipes]